ncbi:hypothetical protein KP78_05330 [Jeotgalibacillus soli]|uniref:Uncharacterized protein n=1 Tax=Jeotgalibacillus soli TaxID=889306 RepID=A0A0C2W809_9BACL|nr:hypothetical protein KP78_05330 [Jeotgalibacillus soli]
MQLFYMIKDGFIRSKLFTDISHLPVIYHKLQQFNTKL